MKHIRFSMFVPLGLAALMLSACAPVTREGATSQATAGHTAAHSSSHWSYTGDTGPAYWGTLNPDYILCSTGTSQSPIDIDEANQVDLDNVVFHYGPSKVKVVNNGHTIEVVYGEGSYMELDGTRYDLDQFHFHAPSEHTIGGQHADLEAHLVHKSADGKLAVVGLLFQEGGQGLTVSPVWNNLAKTETPEQNDRVQINAIDLLPSDQTAFRYSGSLTTPPCTEEVTWLVMAQVREITPEQLAAFTAYYDGNNRPVQPLNGREIQEDITP